MPGLLSLHSPQRGNRSGLLAPTMMADEGDEAFLRRYAAQGYEGQPRAAAAPAAPAPPPPIMSRGMTALQFLAGGTEGVHQERERRRAEALRPEREARMAQMREYAQQMGPAAMIALETNPEAFGESLGMQMRPVTTAEGSITTYGPGANAQRVAAPVVERFDDRFGMIDPLNPQAGAQYTDPRGMTEQERTARITAERPIELAPGATAFNPDGSTFAEGAPRILSAADGTQLYDDRGAPIAENAKDAPGPTAANLEIEGQLSALSTDVEPVLRDMRGLLESGDIISGLGAEARLQAARAAAALGNDKARRQVAATERYRNLSGRLRVGMAKSLGANPSNADIALLERVTAGDIGQSREGLLATLQDGESLAGRQRQALSARRGASPAAAAQEGAVDVASPQEAAALPPGTRFRANGRVYIRE